MSSAHHWTAWSVRRLLEKIEHRGYDGGGPCCPCCYAMQGHVEGCDLKWHIDQLRKETIAKPSVVE